MCKTHLKLKTILIRDASFNYIHQIPLKIISTKCKSFSTVIPYRIILFKAPTFIRIRHSNHIRSRIRRSCFALSLSLTSDRASQFHSIQLKSILIPCMSSLRYLIASIHCLLPNSFHLSRELLCSF